MFHQFGATAESLSKASTAVFRIGTDAALYDDPEDVNIAPLLDSRFDSEKCEALKRLLALIAQGFDVSNFFPQVTPSDPHYSICFSFAAMKILNLNCDFVFFLTLFWFVNENYRLWKTLRRSHWKWRSWFICTFYIMLKSMLYYSTFTTASIFLRCFVVFS